MTRYLTGALAALALTASIAGTTPAHAEHTLCDNEFGEPGNQEIWLPDPSGRLGVGADSTTTRARCTCARSTA